MPHYDWVWGSRPPLLKRHSEVKHALLRNYLIKYFLTLFSRLQREQLRMTVVDGFCGGGLYLNEDGKEMPGSPLVILQAIDEARFLVMTRQERRKPIQIDVELICIDECPSALNYLRNLLIERNYGEALQSERIRLVKGQFAHHSDAVIKRCHDRSRQSGRALFVLDQYGYSSVPMRCLSDIFSSLGKAEVILTFYVDALIKFLDPKNLHQFQMATGISTGMTAAEIDDLKKSPWWRVALQATLYEDVTRASAAKFHTPFFIRPEQGFGDFWLLHLSQHWKARDVMASTHWEHYNHFAHYGGAGFDMFSTGYIGKLDDTGKLQSGFDFSEVAAAVSEDTMLEQIPKLLSGVPDGITFDDFFMRLINSTPATRVMVEKALLKLSAHKEVQVLGDDGVPSAAHVHLKGEHVLRRPSQLTLSY
ncbi:MAG: three-Cys-motif partner protein TcmP [Roseateles sp.]|nr:MAG: three-Cys-motif partner protein TcmP [Roseateles sp.]